MSAFVGLPVAEMASFKLAHQVCAGLHELGQEGKGERFCGRLSRSRHREGCRAFEMMHRKRKFMEAKDLWPGKLHSEILSLWQLVQS